MPEIEGRTSKDRVVDRRSMCPRGTHPSRESRTVWEGVCVRCAEKTIGDCHVGAHVNPASNDSVV